MRIAFTAETTEIRNGVPYLERLLANSDRPPLFRITNDQLENARMDCLCDVLPVHFANAIVMFVMQ